MNRREFIRYGSVATAGTTLLSGCSGSPGEATFEVDYFGEWSGALSTGGNSRSISSRSGSRYSIDNPSVVSGNAQKRDRGTSTLTVQIRANGEVVAQSSTSSNYGLAQVSHTF